MNLGSLRRARWFPLISLVTFAAFGACASTTVLNSQPQGARVTINGAAVGNTPYTLTDTKIVGSSTQLRLEYPGYQTLDVTLTRNEKLDVLALIGGLFLLVPFLWIMEYDPAHTYQLQPAQAWQGAPPAQGWQGAPPPGNQPPGPAGYPPPPPGYPPPAYPPQ